MNGHGSCRKVLISGVTDSYFRLPQNVASLRQIYDVTVESGKVSCKLDNVGTIIITLLI